MTRGGSDDVKQVGVNEFTDLFDDRVGGGGGGIGMKKVLKRGGISHL